ncbi:CRISPR-associated Cmr2 family protein [Thermodesulfitimonas autotrophica]|uniref:CRISPR-associated Cmr2 family protein n=1 Tax=Thermodesulfitimonas autotrophica TaxID=1894989 RepID=A0A3N5BG02_9THEO|nr:type III-B CRISPR-associated protein Cas10/Cmr2 [Thermodesulfitimonas autotrophica]RPF47002.1 CRISPR-associated Cmr2 family protein [Thermodesulfitimonas autotrophica]
MKEEMLLHFSIGPVQGFVAQARKTRDFWAGSFLLSYLAGCAMLKVLEAGGKIILPYVADEVNRITDPLLAAIQKSRGGERVVDGPFVATLPVATLPNRFQAMVPDGFDPADCVKAVNEAWQNLAGVVWERCVAPIAAQGRGTREIWERQVNNFWEVSWAIGKDSALLDRRKNWRSYVPPAEPGDKCSLMGNLQELSGFIRAQEREKQDAFWAALREKVGGHELDEKERLSAIALVKRLFPLMAEQAIGWRLPECQRYPSTPYLAAVPWLKKVIESRPEEARQYAAMAARLPQAKYRENPDRFSGLREALEQCPQAREFASLDGNCFFAAALTNPRLWRDETKKEDATENLRRELAKKLKDLGSPASPFYALLLMDGDRLGALLQAYEPGKVSKALSTFSHQVPKIVREHNGVTVYAGGDDVLALLPLDGAIKAAIALRAAYGASFQGTEVGSEQATISGAIVYAHFTTPLTAVIREAHRLLDKVAKADTGRDSLAVTVWKGAGQVLTWAAPWQVIVDGESNIIDQLANTFSAADTREREYNNTFFYNLRTRFKLLADKEGNIYSEWSNNDMADLMAAEYRKNREREVDWATARQRMERLLRICRRSWRDEEGKIHEAQGVLTLDGALLVKFLVQKGVIR